MDKEIYDILNSYLDNCCDVYGPKQVLRDLIYLGASRKILLKMHFDEVDIDDVFENERNNL